MKMGGRQAEKGFVSSKQNARGIMWQNNILHLEILQIQIILLNICLCIKYISAMHFDPCCKQW